MQQARKYIIYIQTLATLAFTYFMQSREQHKNAKCAARRRSYCWIIIVR